MQEERSRGVDHRVLTVNWADGSRGVFSDGRIYVMNSNGKTVADYNLDNYPLVNTSEIGS